LVIQKSANVLVELSQQFLYAIKMGVYDDHLSNQLKKLSYRDLIIKLQTEDEKKALWINIYNGYAQLILKHHSEKYKSRNSFFNKSQLIIAGERFSLDQIEHGILRHSKIKWGLGYLNKFFPGKREKELRVKKLDCRIHFALNCGAKSCPPVAIYNPENLNSQLELATRSYLSSESSYDFSGNVIYLPALMKWFWKDFGGKEGIKQLFIKYNVIGDKSNPMMKFRNYDWNLFLDHYKTDN
jgi:hypothetical protein